MCPLRFILVFFSAVLAGYLAWNSATSSWEANPEDSTQDNTSSTEQKQEVQFFKMMQSGFWVFMDMASGHYLWRNIKQKNGREVKETS